MVDQITFFRTEPEQSLGTETQWPPIAQVQLSHSCCSTHPGSNCYMRRSGMRVENLNYCTLLKETNLGEAWVFLAPQRCHIEWNKRDYQPLFRKGVNTSRTDLRDQQKSSLKVELRAFLLLFFLRVHPKRYCAINTLSETRIHDFYPIWDVKHPRSFLMEVPGVKW